MLLLKLGRQLIESVPGTYSILLSLKLKETRHDRQRESLRTFPEELPS
jgi:hypothetical protein